MSNHGTRRAEETENISEIVNRDNTLSSGGSPVKLQVITTDKPVKGVLNRTDFSTGNATPMPPGGGERASE
jgi:hypothetical protein